MHSVQPCHKSADIPLSIKATQLASKVDTIIIMSGDSDYVELVRHLKADGVRVEIAAVAATTAQVLIDESNFFHELKEGDFFTIQGKSPKKSSNSKSLLIQRSHQEQTAPARKSVKPKSTKSESTPETKPTVKKVAKKATKKKVTKKKIAKKK